MVRGEFLRGLPMYTGQTLFAQLMDFLPWTTFSRIVNRYGGDYRVRTLPCAEHFRILAFAQLTYRESLRDIEVCLSAQAAKLYHMGIRSPVKRATLADANERRDWRIYAEFAQRLIAQARKLYATTDLGLDLSNTIYALDATTIDLCLALFPWAPFRTTKAAVKLHTLLDLRGAISSFVPHFRRKTARCQRTRPVDPRTGRYLCDGSRLFGLRTVVHASTGRRLLCHPSKVQRRSAPCLFRAERSRARYHLRPDRHVVRVLHAAKLSNPFASHSLQRYRIGKDACLSDQSIWSTGCHDLRLVQGALASRVVLQMDQTAPTYQEVLRHIAKRGEGTNLDRSSSVRARGHRQEAAQPGCLAVHFATDIFTHAVRKNPFKQGLSQHPIHFTGQHDA